MSEVICKHAAECGMLAALNGLVKCHHSVPHIRISMCVPGICNADRHYMGTCVPIEKEEYRENTES